MRRGIEPRALPTAQAGRSASEITPMSQAIPLKRDCPVTLIPSGEPLILPAGTPVRVTQALGGTYTVLTEGGGMARIEGRNADAIGYEPTGAAAAPAPPGGPVEEELVWDQMRTCYDPEIPVNIVDLGLIYDLRVEPTDDGRHRVEVLMTLTAPGCGMGGVIAGDAQQKLLSLPGVSDAVVQVVWDPPWHQSMITPEGRRVLGLE